MIRENHSFLIRSIWRVTHRIVSDQEDVFSVAQMAFNEAIDSYEPERGEFKAFAGVIIKRRLIDYLRSQEKFQKELPSAMEESGEEEPSNLELEVQSSASKQSIRLFQEAERREMLVYEIREAQALLAGYGFALYDLTEASPKSDKTREACKKAIIALLRPGELYEQMRANGSIPMKELEAASGVKRKTLERHRRYIIASAVILAGDFPLLADYLDEIRKELRK